MPSMGKKQNEKKKILHLRCSLIPAGLTVGTLFFFDMEIQHIVFANLKNI